jgi:hypothetical protein
MGSFVRAQREITKGVYIVVDSYWSKTQSIPWERSLLDNASTALACSGLS